MARPVIALLTDFGVRDHYVGTMKGVVLGICPEATLVDITHEVPAQDVESAALELSASFRFFPAGTVFLVVVDPGVGTDRRPMAAEAGGYRFVAPDNGVLSAVFDKEPPRHVVALVENRFALPTKAGVGRTFDGRDRFAPAAAWLARGEALSAFGPPLVAPVRTAFPPPVIVVPETPGVPGALAGRVVRVDRFGNLITNIDRAMIERLAADGPVAVELGGHTLPGLVSAYAEVPRGALCALVSSTGHLEVAVNGASAAAALGLGRGDAVRVARRA